MFSKAIIDGNLIASITSSIELEKRGGKVNIFNESWIFEHKSKSGDSFAQNADINEYFGQLGEILSAYDGREELSISITTSTHIIGLRCAGTTKSGGIIWEIADSANMPPKTVSHFDLGFHIRNAVHSGITKDHQPDTAMHIAIHTTGDKKNNPQMQKLVPKLKDFKDSITLAKKCLN